MGYCYTQDNRLCCDICGNSGGVRKYRCPFNWCQPLAACKSCRSTEKHRFSRGFHRADGCEKASLRFNEQKRQTKALQDAGIPTRCAALGVVLENEDKVVHVLFSYADESTVGYYMSHEVYDGIPLLTPASPKDYAKLGQIKSAPCETL